MGLTITMLACVLALDPPVPEGPQPARAPAFSAAETDAWYRKHARLEAQLAFSGVGTAFGGALAVAGGLSVERRARAGFLTVGVSTFALGVTGLAIAGSRLRTHRTRRPTPGRDTEWLGRRLALHRNLLTFGAITAANVAIAAGSMAIGAASPGDPQAPDAVTTEIAFYPAIGVAASGILAVGVLGLALRRHHVAREFTPLQVRAGASGVILNF